MCSVASLELPVTVSEVIFGLSPAFIMVSLLLLVTVSEVSLLPTHAS